jgi:tetratricopeptide (TPR) repeat protein
MRAARRLHLIGHLAALCLVAGVAQSQEFTRQEVFVAQFRSDTAGGLPALARELVELTRDRLEKPLEKSGAHGLEGYKIANYFQRADLKKTIILNDAELRILATELRADETVHGQLARQDGQLVLRARIGRLRSWGLQQPLPTVRGSTVAALADQLVPEVLKARAQMTPLRRCENALLRGDHAMAAREAEVAIRAYPAATIARACLLSALLNGGGDARTLLAVADTTLGLDSTNTVAAVTRAQALEALKRTSPAVQAWERVYALHPDSAALASSATEALLRLQEPARALRQIRAMQARFGARAEFRRLAFRAHTALNQWPAAAALGDTLERDDATFRADSNYVTRYIEALRQTNDTLAAIEIGARAVRRHPGDARIYLQYLALINAEQPMVLPRALARFPSVADFRLLAANSARKSGDRQAAIANTKAAVEGDSAALQPYLALAEDYLQLQAADSALRVLQRAPRVGADRERLRSYVLARGVGLLRGGGGDSVTAAQRTALAMVTLADSLRSADDTRGVMAAAALQQARAALIAAGRTKACTDLEPMNAMLALASSAVTTGIGEGASAIEIQGALTAMLSAGDQARKLYCKAPPP